MYLCNYIPYLLSYECVLVWKNGVLNKGRTCLVFTESNIRKIVEKFIALGTLLLWQSQHKILLKCMTERWKWKQQLTAYIVAFSCATATKIILTNEVKQGGRKKFMCLLQVFCIPYGSSLVPNSPHIGKFLILVCRNIN